MGRAMIPGFGRKRPLIDQQPPKAPYFLAAEDLFLQKEGKEIYVKHIFSVSEDIPKYGPVVMSPGLCSNANLFRVDKKGRCLALNHNQSFANLLASEGFDVYLYHPGYSERVQNRYVSRHCKDSIYYKNATECRPNTATGTSSILKHRRSSILSVHTAGPEKFHGSDTASEE